MRSYPQDDARSALGRAEEHLRSRRFDQALAEAEASVALIRAARLRDEADDD